MEPKQTKKKKIDRRTVGADVLGLERSELKPYQSGRHRPPVFDDGTGAVCVCLAGEAPAAGWEWHRKGERDGAVVWIAEG